MEDNGEKFLSREKDGFLHCKTCSKKFFSLVVFKKHLKNEHSATIKLKEDKEPKKDPIANEGFNPLMSRNQTSVKLEIMSSISDTTDKLGFDAPSNLHISTDQKSAPLVKSEVAFNTLSTIKTPRKKSKDSNLQSSTNKTIDVMVKLEVTAKSSDKIGRLSKNPEETYLKNQPKTGSQNSGSPTKKY